MKRSDIFAAAMCVSLLMLASAKPGDLNLQIKLFAALACFSLSMLICDIKNP